MDQIIKVAWELNENAENRYRLVYEIAELAKKLVDETQMKKVRDEFGFEEAVTDNAYKKENPVEHAIMVKASESDNTELVGQFNIFKIKKRTSYEEVLFFVEKYQPKKYSSKWKIENGKWKIVLIYLYSA